MRRQSLPFTLGARPQVRAPVFDCQLVSEPDDSKHAEEGEKD